MKAKKIVGIVIITLFTLLACLVVVSAFVPKNFTMPLDNPQRVVIKTSTGNQEISNTDERYNEIMNLFNDGFKSSYLEAFFQGKLFAKVKTGERSYKTLSSLTNNDEVIYIEFQYGEDKETKVINSNVELQNSEKTYRSVVVEIHKNNNLTQINAYIKDTETGSHIRYISYARHGKLFAYLNENFVN